MIECLACRHIAAQPPEAVIETKFWRGADDYADLLNASTSGIPIHDKRGDCVEVIVRMGYSQANLPVSVVYVPRRIRLQPSASRERVISLDEFSIFEFPELLPQWPTWEEEAQTLTTIGNSMRAIAARSSVPTRP